MKAEISFSEKIEGEGQDVKQRRSRKEREKDKKPKEQSFSLKDNAMGTEDDSSITYDPDAKSVASRITLMSSDSYTICSFNPLGCQTSDLSSGSFNTFKESKKFKVFQKNQQERCQNRSKSRSPEFNSKMGSDSKQKSLLQKKVESRVYNVQRKDNSKGRNNQTQRITSGEKKFEKKSGSQTSERSQSRKQNVMLRTNNNVLNECQSSKVLGQPISIGGAKTSSRNNPLGLRTKTTREVSPNNMNSGKKNNFCNTKENEKLDQSTGRQAIEKSYQSAVSVQSKSNERKAHVEAFKEKYGPAKSFIQLNKSLISRRSRQPNINCQQTAQTVLAQTEKLTGNNISRNQSERSLAQTHKQQKDEESKEPIKKHNFCQETENKSIERSTENSSKNFQPLKEANSLISRTLMRAGNRSPPAYTQIKSSRNIPCNLKSQKTLNDIVKGRARSPANKKSAINSRKGSGQKVSTKKDGQKSNFSKNKSPVKSEERSLSNSKKQYMSSDLIDLTKGVSEDKQNVKVTMTKQELLNYDISNVWKEMEEMNRSKKAAQHLVQSFKDQEKSPYLASKHQKVASPFKKSPVSIKNQSPSPKSVQKYASPVYQSKEKDEGTFDRKMRKFIEQARAKEDQRRISFGIDQETLEDIQTMRINTEKGQGLEQVLTEAMEEFDNLDDE